MPDPTSASHERWLLQRLALGPASGGELARETGLTRAAIWKRIQALRAAGVAIEAAAGRGYRLAAPLDLLNAAAITRALPAPVRTQLAGLDIAWSLDSTNSQMLRQTVPASGCAVLLAERQTGGRGRRGRRWVSPLAAHVYLSLARRFDSGLAQLGGLSLVAGIAAAEAVRALGVPGCGLKWPNDVWVGGRKLGGVLIEAVGEAEGPVQAVIGLGLNVRMPAAQAADIDQPWIDLQTCLQPTPPRNVVVAMLLERLLPALDCFAAQGLAPFLSRWPALDLLAGVSVRICLGTDQNIQGTAEGIASDGALRVRINGVSRHVHAGEVSVRPQG